MSYRTFIDDDGTPWQVWDVRPDDSERRVRERRMRHDPPGDERRDLEDRRGRIDVRANLPPELVEGWLVFRSPHGRKRFWPIPPGWDQLSIADLREICQQARVVAENRHIWPRDIRSPEPEC